MRIDGADLRDVRLDALRRQIGIVPQEGFLFAGTVAREHRLRAARRDARRGARRGARPSAPTSSSRRCRRATRRRSQERGGRLSIGQRQLVALARALVVDPRILILDEATSSVDIATEQRIEEALSTLLAGRTAFVVAHRLSTIRRADLIVVLEHGRVVEQGTHADLLAARGRYRALYGDWVEATA